MVFTIVIIDILVCTVLIRFVLGWILANRNLLRLVLSLILLSVGVLLVNNFHLPLAQWLSATVALPLAILLISVFLPDVRSAYYASTANVLHFLKKQAYPEISQIVAEALLELAQRRWGALLVFVRSDDVSGAIVSGEVYDAKVTKTLLVSLFNPASPRHDGAVIIRGDRIVRAGAILPLTACTNAKDYWGTRHRAAQSVTEFSDAVVAVVSEERGTITIGQSDTLDELTAPSLSGVVNCLAPHLLSPAPVSHQLVSKKRTVMLWLISFAAACIASASISWLQYFTETGPTKLLVVQAPIYYASIPDHLFLEDCSAYGCRIYLRLAKEENLQETINLDISLDLKDYPVGSSEIPLSQASLSGLPAAWEVERYDPDSVIVLLSEARILPFSIEPKFTALKDSLEISSWVVQPSNMLFRIKGSGITTADPIATQFINLSRISEAGTFRYESYLTIPSSLRPVEGGKNPKVTVIVSVASVPEKEKLPGSGPDQ